MSAQFCPLCDVTLDLHDGPNSCDSADATARLLESFPFGGARTAIAGGDA